MKKNRMMIVDAHNQFLRSYIVDPSLSLSGSPIGGSKGFLKILNKLCRIISPDLVVVIWDGQGGSQKRKSQNKNYKAGRKPLRLNRTDVFLTEKEIDNNKLWQQLRVIEYINQTPIVQFMEDNVEADDVISYVKNLDEFESWQKVIVSSDKDFFQLLDKETILYRPTQGEMLNENRILDRYEIHPNNFALARAIAGDPSDNLRGIKGAGLSTVSKRFPFLKNEKCYLVKDLLEYALENENSNLKIYERMVENSDLVKQNYSIMQLTSPALSIQSKQRVSAVLKNYKPQYNKTAFLGLLLKDGLGEIQLMSLEQSFKKVVANFKTLF